ncbi:DUF2125 domain-containing protein [Nisaea sp.]|uniref:DUF2125 domain-containing protein n=1 Tax=Nisaea sp. TaxID=2024842 RepID=UPI0032ED4AA8
MHNEITTPPAPHKRPRRIGTVLSFVLALAVLTYVGNWFAAAFWLEGRIEDWAAAERARGNEVVFGDLRFEGFPFAMSILAPDALYRRHRGAVVETVTAERLRLSARPWAPLDMTLTAERGLTASQAVPDRGTLVTLTAAPDTRVDAYFHSSGVLKHARLSAAGGRLVSARDGDPAGPREAARVGATTATLDQADAIVSHMDAAAVVSLTAARVETPALRQLGTDADHAALFLEATLRGALSGTGATDLALWRDSGGTVDIDRLTLSIDPVALKLNATFALDRLLRPEGAGTLEIKGFDEALEDLVGAGHLKRDAAEIARLVLGAFSRNSSADGTRIVSMPVAAQDGRVSAGPFTLFRFPAL